MIWMHWTDREKRKRKRKRRRRRRVVPVQGINQGLDLLQRALARHPTAVVALHDRELALQCCDRIIGLGEGKILLDAPASTLTLSDLDTLYQ